ncbi:hypothetical protein [Megamonas funiformis]|uniref:Oligosaccharide repeat unit polymerase n=1 Tax=Megamonas funiformis TaxID=437897 RepID=A0AAW4U6G3_9FIRM|nr:hypothetical protein [Megamonas funiformis]MCB6828882.1 hypothetical protein [Megamonas funiformis]
MTFFEYGKIIDENVILYITLLLLIGLIMIFLLKKQMFFIIDPFISIIFLFTVYFTTVIFLYILGYISDFYLLNYILCFLFFLLGLYLNGKPNRIKKCIVNKYKVSDNIFFFIAFIIYIFFKFYLIIKFGVPLLVEDSDRSTFYSEAGLEKLISDIFMIVVLFFLVEKININHLQLLKNIKSMIILLSILFILILDGSKSNFVTVIMAIYIYKYYFTLNNMGAAKKVLFAMISIFILIVFIKSTNDFEQTVNNIIIAIINRADTYIYVYTSDYKDISNYFNGNIITFFEIIFYIPLNGLGLISENNRIEFFSQKIEQYIYGDSVSLGPNAIYNLIGLVYLGNISSIIFSFFIGYSISFFRNKLIRIFNYNNFFIRYIFFLIQINIVSLIGAPTLFIGNMMYYILIPGSIYVIIKFLLKNRR